MYLHSTPYAFALFYLPPNILLFIYIYLFSFVPIDKKVLGQRFLCVFSMLLYFQHLEYWLGKSRCACLWYTHTQRKIRDWLSWIDTRIDS